LFQELPSKEDYPDYYEIIDDPIALDIIQVYSSNYSPISTLINTKLLMI
jgi:hypothetical protein